MREADGVSRWLERCRRWRREGSRFLFRRRFNILVRAFRQMLASRPRETSIKTLAFKHRKNTARHRSPLTAAARFWCESCAQNAKQARPRLPEGEGGSALAKWGTKIIILFSYFITVPHVGIWNVVPGDRHFIRVKEIIVEILTGISFTWWSHEEYSASGLVLFYVERGRKHHDPAMLCLANGNGRL